MEVYQVWSDSIGLLQENSIGQYDMILRGCVIDGIVYGDTNTYVSVEDDFYKSEEFYLLQNYPNPFNPSTNIIYSLKEAGNVVVRVYNVLGQEVSKLVDEYKEPGFYNIDFDGSQLSSGLYLYSLEINNFKLSKKMILAK